MDDAEWLAEEMAADELFIRWVKHPDGETERHWQQWLQQHPQQQETLEEARRLVLLMAFEQDLPEPDHVARIHQQVYSRLNLKNTRSQVRALPLQRVRRHRFAPWQRMAAVWAGLIVSTIVLWMLIDRYHTKEYQTGYGQTQTVQLPDGSSVVLNANSAIRFKANWDDQDKRVVWLDGEAFFDVKHRVNHQPFLVYADEVQVKVLGTSFNVRQREDRVSVVLVNGKVRLTYGHDHELEMKPGDLVELAGASTESIRQHVNVQNYTAWKEQQLRFDHTTLREVGQLIEEKYGYQVRIEDTTLLNQRLTLKLPTDQLPVLLESLEKLFDLKVIREEKHLVFTRNATP